MKYINVIIKTVVIALLIMAVMLNHKYSYYELLRWIVTASCVWFIYCSVITKSIGFIVCFTTIALLFNPIIKVWLQKEIWHIADLTTAIIIAISILHDFKITMK